MNSVQGYRAHASPPALCLRHSLLGPTGPLACLVASFAAPSYMLICSTYYIRVVKTGVMVIRGPIDPTHFSRNPLKVFLSMIGLSFRLSCLPTALRTSVEAKSEPSDTVRALFLGQMCLIFLQHQQTTKVHVFFL